MGKFLIADHSLNTPYMFSACDVAEVVSRKRSHQIRFRRRRFLLLMTPKMQTYRLLFFIVMISMLAVVSGCATVIRTPLPADQYSDARIMGMTDVRYWGDSLSPKIYELIALQASQAESYSPQAFRRTSYNLAISGGGANGAFGAGLLVGWSEAGDRPTFSIVTGISTGALIAPFAFLGSKYDEQLRQVYTTTATKDILKLRSLVTFLSSDAAADSKPLLDIIRRYMTQDMLDDIAAEYAKGRRLIVGTTNLDAKRPVLWDITAIAASGRKEALRLVRNVILASASIPGVFPPVYIKVEANGKQYDEMHVDGGMAFQVFLYPPQLDHKRLSKIIKRDFGAHIYVIRNARLDPKWKTVPPRLGQIAEESISTLILNQGMGNLELIYFLAMRDGYDFNLAYIPSEFEEKPKEQFDSEYMKKLFDEGYNLARTGYPWQKIPPRLKKPEDKR